MSLSSPPEITCSPVSLKHTAVTCDDRERGSTVERIRITFHCIFPHIVNIHVSVDYRLWCSNWEFLHFLEYKLKAAWMYSALEWSQRSNLQGLHGTCTRTCSTLRQYIPYDLLMRNLQIRTQYVTMMYKLTLSNIHQATKQSHCMADRGNEVMVKADIMWVDSS